MHKQIKYLLFINSFFVFAINLFAPLFALYVKKIEDAVYHVGGIWGFYIILTGIFVLVASRYENKLKYADHFLIAGFLFRAIGWGGYIFATTTTHLYIIQVFLALGEAFGTPSYGMLFSTYLDKGMYATEWGLQTSIGAFLTGGAAIAGSLIVHSHGFTPLFVIMIVMSFASTAAALAFKKQLVKR